MDRCDRGDHDGCDRRRRERCQQAEHQEQTAARLEDPGCDRMVPARSQAERVEESGRAGDSVAAEPAKELLSPVADEEQADHKPEDEHRDVHERLRWAPGTVAYSTSYPLPRRQNGPQRHCQTSYGPCQFHA